MQFPPQLVSFCQKLVHFFEGDARHQAVVVYGELMQQARAPWLFTTAKVPDTVDGRFEMLVIHIFLYLRRLRMEGGEDHIHMPLEKALVELMFDDMDQSLREMGVGDMSVGKKVKVMAEGMYGRFKAYNESLENVESVNQTLRRNIYGTLKDSAIDAKAVEKLQIYLGTLQQHFDGLSIQRITHGMLRLTPPEQMVSHILAK